VPRAGPRTSQVWCNTAFDSVRVYYESLLFGSYLTLAAGQEKCQSLLHYFLLGCIIKLPEVLFLGHLRLGSLGVLERHHNKCTFSTLRTSPINHLTFFSFRLSANTSSSQNFFSTGFNLYIGLQQYDDDLRCYHHFRCLPYGWQRRLPLPFQRQLGHLPTAGTLRLVQ
jgi:hypothetical protein